MTETAHDPHAAWMKRFADELRLRHVEQEHIDTALDSIREHLTDSGDSLNDAFGDPREYAANLDLPTRDEGYGRAGTYAAVAAAVVSFLMFGIAVTRWIDGEATPAVIGWTLASAVVLLASSIWATVGIARHVVDAAIRERFSGATAGRWERWAPLAIATPFVFPVFAAIIVFIGALHS
ncbi:hypothetical protein BAURA86_00905 [Brevibacterium aurantiacum]|uniref:Uncharacterized protein n=1 Tax=Brevibacterium aurantiacum TaxID=273384 RepID=A0A2H1IRJ6_BREAU|nr:hypothetical protein [Brevibacterium aurantiacum]SMX77849.1 hypothetical protein BAURA86_00905 [Brevibacterium aurantiacum]